MKKHNLKGMRIPILRAYFMKKLPKILFILAIIFLFVGCQKENKVVKTDSSAIIDQMKIPETIHSVMQKAINDDDIKMKKILDSVQICKETVSTETGKTKNETNRIKNDASIIKQDSISINTYAKNIKKDVNEANIPSTIAFNIRTNTDKIIEKTQNIQRTVEDINKATIAIEKSNKKIEEDLKVNLFIIEENTLLVKSDLKILDAGLENIQTNTIIVVDLIKQLEKDKNLIIEEKIKSDAEKKAETQKQLRWLIISCVIFAGVSVALGFLVNIKIGIGGFIGSIVTLGLAVALSEHLLIIAAVGAGIIILIFLAAIAYIVWQMLAYKKAFGETVKTVEVVKQNIPAEAKEKIFGTKKASSIVNQIQSTKTQQLIQDEKKKLGELWDYFKNKIENNDSDNSQNN